MVSIRTFNYVAVMKATVFHFIFSLFILIIDCDGKEDDRSMKIRNKRLDSLVGGLLDQMVVERLERKKILEEFEAFKTQVGVIGRKLKVRNNLLQDTKLLQKKILRDVKDMKEKVQEVAQIEVKTALKRVFRRMKKQEKVFSNEIINTNKALKGVSTAVDGTKTKLLGVEQKCDLIQKGVEVLKKKSDDRWKTIAFSTCLMHHPLTSSALVFKGVFTNIGGGYNVSDGTFYCPKGGIYVFAISLEGQMRENVYAYLMKNNQNIAYVHENVGESNGYPSVSATIAIKLSFGDKVWIKGMGIKYNYRSSFTGVYVGP